MADINDVEFTGNLSGDIYFITRTLRDGRQSPYLRVMMFVHGRKPSEDLENLRIVFTDDLAELANAYVQPGAKLLVKAHAKQRVRADKSDIGEDGKPKYQRITEYVCYKFVPLKGSDFERGDARKKELAAEGKFPQQGDAIPVDWNEVRAPKELLLEDA